MDLKGLPQELLDELLITKQSGIYKRILDIIGHLSPNPVTIDEILIGLYRKYTIVYKRPYILNALFRLRKKNLIVKAAGKKGVYIIKKEEKK